MELNSVLLNLIQPYSMSLLSWSCVQRRGTATKMLEVFATFCHGVTYRANKNICPTPQPRPP